MKSSEKNSALIQRIGVLSDTHGLLRPEVINALKGVDQIIHAGDLDTPEILRALEKIGPITAVKGNMDRGGWTRKLNKTEVVEVGNHLLYVLHEIHALDLESDMMHAFAVFVQKFLPRAGFAYRLYEFQRDIAHLEKRQLGPGLCGSAAKLGMGLILVAIGTGAIKPCVSANVGDQFGKTNKHLIGKVYNWFYFAINFGAFISNFLSIEFSAFFHFLQEAFMSSGS